MTRLLLAMLTLVSAVAFAQPQSTQPAAPAAPAAERYEARFRIFARGVPLGNEVVVIETTATEWKSISHGQLAAPLSFVLNEAQIRYDRAWHPTNFILDARTKDKPLRIMTTVGGGKATSTIVQDDKSESVTHDVSEATILLPNNVYAAYEPVVARFATMKPGESLRAYVAPQSEITITLDSVTIEHVKTTARAFESRHYKATALNPGSALKIELWADDRQHLMRFQVPQIPIEVVREDIAAVSTRLQTTVRPNDEDVFIQANGFNLAATVSKPQSSNPPSPNDRAGQAKAKQVKWPAVILVGGSGAVDRDETVAGIPIFAQMGSALADAGYLVVRYDKRGVGQSGGRTESASLLDYSEDVRAIVRYLAKRKDVDNKRIAVAGHSEGAAVAMLAAQKDGNIRALVLMAGPGTSGADLILEQQAYMLGRMKLEDADKQAKIDLQRKIQAAVVSGQGWEAIPPDLRRGADTPWFSSFLQFDPAKVMVKVKQPILVVQGDLDRQVQAHHADMLATAAKARKKAADIQVAHFSTLNHLLVTAKTGDVDEYPTLEPKVISMEVPERIITWLTATMMAKT